LDIKSLQRPSHSQSKRQPVWLSLIVDTRTTLFEWVIAKTPMEVQKYRREAEPLSVLGVAYNEASVVIAWRKPPARRA
jgi:hypothetical protein